MTHQTSAAAYRARTIKRERRTATQVEQLDEQILEVLAEDHPQSVRHVFYRMTDPRLAELVEKSDRGYRAVQDRCVKLRRSGRLPYGWITDSSRRGYQFETFDGTADFLRRMKALYRADLWSTSDYYAEVWTESRSIAGVIEGDCDELAVSLYPAGGFTSLSLAYQSADAINHYARDKPAVIFYIGDFDPAGVLIDVALERELREHLAPGIDLTFERIAITPQQIDLYALPTKPRKEGERRARYVRETVEAEAMPAHILRDQLHQHIEHLLPEHALAVAELEEQAARDTGGAPERLLELAEAALEAPQEEPEAPLEGEAEGLRATPFTWRDPTSIPPRVWLYGWHLLRKQVSVTVAPDGAGKSSLTVSETLAMVTGRPLLGDRVPAPLTVWLFNLEDPREELERRITAAMLHHDVRPEDLGGRLYVNSGRERGLCTAVQGREGVMIVRPEFAALERELKANRIDVLTVDPFISSHQLAKNDNPAIDLVTKEWARLAERCDCAVELIHHTRKTNGAEPSTEDGRGATALLYASRSGRVLAKMDEATKAKAGIEGDLATYFAVLRDKANLAPVGKRTWRRIASVDLGNGDSVGVVDAWEWPDALKGFDVGDLLQVQRAIAARCEAGSAPRYSHQAEDDWVGLIVAKALDLDPTTDRARVQRMVDEWLKSGALAKRSKTGPNRACSGEKAGDRA